MSMIKFRRVAITTALLLGLSRVGATSSAADIVDAYWSIASPAKLMRWVKASPEDTDFVRGAHSIYRWAQHPESIYRYDVENLRAEDLVLPLKEFVASKKTSYETERLEQAQRMIREYGRKDENKNHRDHWKNRQDLTSQWIKKDDRTNVTVEDIKKALEMCYKKHDTSRKIVEAWWDNLTLDMRKQEKISGRVKAQDVRQFWSEWLAYPFLSNPVSQSELDSVSNENIHRALHEFDFPMTSRESSCRRLAETCSKPFQAFAAEVFAAAGL